MLKRIMVRAHQIAKGMEGDYQAKLALALRQAWEEERGNEEMEDKEAKDERISLELLAKVTKRDPERLKINTTIKRDFPAVFKENCSSVEIQKTIDNMLSEAGIRSEIRRNFKKTLKEKGYGFKKCMNIMNEGKEGFEDFALRKLEELA